MAVGAVGCWTTGIPRLKVLLCHPAWASERTSGARVAIFGRVRAQHAVWKTRATLPAPANHSQTAVTRLRRKLNGNDPQERNCRSFLLEISHRNYHVKSHSATEDFSASSLDMTFWPKTTFVFNSDGWFKKSYRKKKKLWHQKVLLRFLVVSFVLVNLVTCC